MKTCDEQLTSIEYKKGFIGVSIYCFLKIYFRDMMMYDPSALTPDVWAKYTRALTDCNSKTEDYVATRGGGSPYSTDQVYEYLLDPKGNDIHHFILQYLEEGTIDLVCLSTDLEMEHCDVMRDSANAIKGN